MAEDRLIQRIQPKEQTLQEAYDAPANFLEIDVVSPETHGIGNKRYTDYEVRMKVLLYSMLCGFMFLVM